MKKLIHAALLGAMISTPVFAAESQSTANPAADGTNAINTSGLPTSVAGTVQSVDQDSKRLRVKDNQSGSVTEIQANADTKVTTGAESVPFSQLQAGDVVLIAYNPDNSVDKIEISQQ